MNTSRHTATASARFTRGQRGAVLVVSLLILLVLTLIGVTALQTTSLEERMAGNLRDQNLAFQAAEAALRDAQGFLQQAVLPAFDGNGGLFQPAGEGQPPRWTTIDWATQARAYDGDAIAGVASQPRYIIEQLAPFNLPGGSLAADEPLPDVGIYRVTARAVGGSANAVVVLQVSFIR